MTVTKRYAVYCRCELIGEYTAVDAAEMLKCTPGTVRTYASYGKALYGEYTFEVIESGWKSHGLRVTSGLWTGRRQAAVACQWGRFESD